MPKANCNCFSARHCTMLHAPHIRWSSVCTCAHHDAHARTSLRREMVVHIFAVLYTKHKTQKSKKWLDGTLRFNDVNRKVRMHSHKRQDLTATHTHTDGHAHATGVPLTTKQSTHGHTHICRESCLKRVASLPLTRMSHTHSHPFPPFLSFEFISFLLSPVSLLLSFSLLLYHKHHRKFFPRDEVVEVGSELEMDMHLVTVDAEKTNNNNNNNNNSNMSTPPVCSKR